MKADINSNINPQSFYQGFAEAETAEDMNAPKTIILLAYHKYLLRCSGGERDVLASLILDDVMEQSPAAFELLKHITDGEITEDTIIQAAQLLIDSNK